ncbi:DUF386 domain-containing protein [Vibrio albus]|uniref:DUF386 domain-containing protein n=1 Tax=Vibrio albus TaxID=2200953 RepID=A0A2U3B6T1_9VIBR|nr:YhcH/YjgK/YiaL family protein [Vibrio albus]PWI32434.1 DUF386 domain-containing protein [Vibrio albus]
MLFGNINQLELIPYTYTKLRKCIEEAVVIAKNNPEGKYALTDDRIFVMINATTTEPTEERAAEIHKKYIDIQIVLEGEERFGYSNQLDDSFKSLEKLENDVLFIENVTHENYIDLYVGDFVVFYPEQIHRPQCAVNKPMPIKKAVIKIPHDIFS